jgi:hypothetical protein
MLLAPPKRKQLFFLQHFGDTPAYGQCAGQAWRLDAKKIDEPGHTVI